jgi:hypothetical protein
MGADGPTGGLVAGAGEEGSRLPLAEGGTTKDPLPLLLAAGGTVLLLPLLMLDVRETAPLPLLVLLRAVPVSLGALGSMLRPAAPTLLAPGEPFAPLGIRRPILLLLLCGRNVTAVRAVAAAAASPSAASPRDRSEPLLPALCLSRLLLPSRPTAEAAIPAADSSCSNSLLLLLLLLLLLWLLPRRLLRGCG